MNLLALTWEEKYKRTGDPLTLMRDLIKLARSNDAYFRGRVAQNPTISENLLKSLAKDTDANVRRAVGENPKTAKNTLGELAQDSNAYVRRGVICNPNVSISLLIKILEYERNCLSPDRVTIRTLYNYPKLPNFAKDIIETLYGQWIYNTTRRPLLG